jgi:hypothetical protein
MNPSLSMTLFLYFAVACIGAAVGALIQRAQNKRSTLPPPPVSPAASEDTLANEGDVEVLRAWRTSSNTLWLEMDGKRLESKGSLQPTQRQRLLNLVLDLRPWLETVQPAAPARPAPPVMAVPVAPAPVPPAPVAAAPVAPAPVTAPQTLRADKKKNAPAIEEAKPAPVLESIIQQIDKVLQVKLATSTFKDRDIQLVEGPGGIVIVKDGVNKYEGLDTIPEPEIKALIRQAVADWEKGAK